MIDPDPTWSCEVRPSGVVLTPPEGAAVGTITYLEDRAPLLRLGGILESLPAVPGLAIATRTAPKRLVTIEGEHAVLIVDTGTVGGAPVERTIGLVFGDRSYSAVIAVARRSDAFARFRDEARRLVLHDTYMRGDRARRFCYAPPPGWHAVATGALHVSWLPLDYPRRRTMLTMYPALPLDHGIYHAHELVSLVATRWAKTGALRALGLVCSASGLSGDSWEILSAQDDEVREAILLEDGRYVYPLVLERRASDSDASAVLRRVVDSVEPVPRPAHRRAQLEATTFAHWTE